MPTTIKELIEKRNLIQNPELAKAAKAAAEEEKRQRDAEISRIKNLRYPIDDLELLQYIPEYLPPAIDNSPSVEFPSLNYDWNSLPEHCVGDVLLIWSFLGIFG